MQAKNNKIKSQA